ncbi:hypothetical protein E2C01_013161 [Portunus trituberculatus]|uniref:Uncharacterized protein n=1 Tax=Portunus trituberculatus TaxID=210409 RepID=A0A5B7DGJ5_PORTR|nr:hypothetical protein [Portunus trituberculatus]
MALPHKTAVSLIPLLLCLRLPGIACAGTLQELPSKEKLGGEAWASLEAEIHTVGQLQEADDETATEEGSNLKVNMTRERKEEDYAGENEGRTGEEKPGAQEEAAQGIIESSGESKGIMSISEQKDVEEDDVLLTVTFMKEGHPLILDLHPTRDLLAASYMESNGEATGENTLPGEVSRCDAVFHSLPWSLSHSCAADSPTACFACYRNLI